MAATDPDISRPRLIRDASFLEANRDEIAQRRGAHNRLGFAYQIAFVRVLGRFPRQAPLEIDGEILRFAALQLRLPPETIHAYAERRQTVSEHQQRIRNLHRQRIYCADPERHHGPLETVLRRNRRAVNFRLVAEQWERIGQFYAAFPAGHATASAALQRLNRFQASNRFYAANRELGRALKTEFVLQYMAEPQLRAKVRRGLLKVEQLHALARAVYYGNRGRISAREVYDQINACSCLTLILACIIKRFGKRQQMRWSKGGAHLMLQTRTRTLDGTLREKFEQWYPGLKVGDGSVKAEQIAA